VVTSYVELPEGVDPVLAVGVLISAAGRSLQAAVANVPAEINAIEVQVPWGNDKYGTDKKEGFLAAYHGNGEVQFSESLKDDLSKAGKNVGDIGDTVMVTMTDYLSTDAGNATDLRQQ
jgi:hypothetical protein